MAVRHIGALHRAGLLLRLIRRLDPNRNAYYWISAKGTHLLEQRLLEARSPVPLALGQRGDKDPDHFEISDFFVRLVDHARTTRKGHLNRWRHAMDTAAWLRQHGIR
jgi:hypothetical protein